MSRKLEQHSRRATGEQAWEADRELPPNTGPVTADQLAAIGALEALADGQAAEGLTREPVLPPYAGLRTGDDLVPLQAETEDRRKQPRARRGLKLVPWPLFGILAVQAVLSLRLVFSNTAFTDEALYLWAGNMEWAHLIHGSPIPPFPTYLSGAPVIYPPIGALADSIGGLAGARILSLVFMLGVTSLLWSTARRLYGSRAAFFAAALFVALGPSIRLGAFATYDPMALFLLALSAWCALRGGARQDATGWALATAAALLAANLAKYATILFDPVVFVLAWLGAYPEPGGKPAQRRLAATASFWLIGGVVFWEIATLGNGYYITGIEATTLDRAPSNASMQAVMADSWRWIGVAVVSSAVALLIVRMRRAPWHSVSLMAALSAAAVLAPLEQARIHTNTSLDKHVDFGAWFACIAAGYAADWLVRHAGRRLVAGVLTVAASGALAVYAVMAGLPQAKALFNWQNDTPLIAALRTHLTGVHGNVLIDKHSEAEYYLKPGAGWKYWSSTTSLILPSGKAVGTPAGSTGSTSNLALYEHYIGMGYFKLIELNTFSGLGEDLTGFLSNDKSYVVVADGFLQPEGFFVIWKYEPRETLSGNHR